MHESCASQMFEVWWSKKEIYDGQLLMFDNQAIFSS